MTAHPHIAHTTRRAYRVVGSRLDLWTFIGGWFVGGHFPEAAAADHAGTEFVETGRWPVVEPNLPARLDALRVKRRAAA